MAGKADNKVGIRGDRTMDASRKSGKGVIREVRAPRSRVVKLKDMDTGSEQREKVLRYSQTQLLAIFESAPVMMFLVDSGNRVRMANIATTEFSNRQLKEIIGLRAGEVLRCIHSLDEPKGCGFGDFCTTCVARNTVLNTFETGQSYYQVESQFPFIREQKQQVLNVLISTMPLMVSDEKMVLVCIEDISDRKQVEQALLGSKQQFRDFFENALIGFHIFAPNRFIIGINQAELDMIGYKRDEVISKKTWADLIIPEQKDQFEKHWQDILTKGEVRNLEYTLIHKDGHHIDVILNASARFDKNGNIINTRGSVLDITERRRAEHQIKNLAKFPSENPNPILRIAKDGVLLYANAASESFLAEWGCEVNQKVPDYWYQTVLETLASGSQKMVEIKHSHRIFSFAAAPVIKAGYVNLYGRDITERMKVKESLKRIEWLLTKSVKPRSKQEKDYCPSYGDLDKINTNRLLLDSIVKDVLSDVVDDFLDLLDTSAAVYERNGDYALGIFGSAWCKFLDQTSRNLCGTDDNKKALESGKWHCHESCWTEAARASIETGQPVDIECNGGIRLYAVPIRTRGEIIGSINFGYGDPPKDPRKLEEIAERYGVSTDELRQHAEAYEPRPLFVIDVAKSRLLTSARLIGTMVDRKLTQDELQKTHYELELRVEERTAELAEANVELQAEITERTRTEKMLRTLASELSLAEEHEKRRIATELHDNIGQDLALSILKLDMLRKSALPNNFGELLDEIRERLEKMIQNTRSLTFDLSSPILYKFGFEQAVEEWLFEQIRDRHNIRTEFICNKHSKPLKGDIGILLFRSVRELLFNIVKHAQANSVKVSICRRDKQIQVVVEDDGIGLDTSKIGPVLHRDGGFGLFGIRERLDYIGGDFKIESDPGQGTRVTLTAPLKTGKKATGEN